MVIKAEPQILKRISVRWLPESAYENTNTVALNVGGYFMDLRVVTSDNSLEWSRAGERMTIGENPSTFQWTRIVDSTGITQTDEAAFMVLPNGDDLETGVFNKEGIPTQYEEVWRDATTEMGGYGAAWIIQSSDGSTFLGRIGRMFIAMRQSPRGFAVRREALSESSEHWVLIFEDGPTRNLPRAVDVISAVNCDMEIGGKLTVQNAEFLIRGFGIV